MDRSTRRIEFFKRLNTSDPLGRYGKINKKNISKRQGIKGQHATVEYRYLR
ncbi:MAG: hypothetical protein ACMUEL_03780 [Flavobacteriales bacterium Tduv]